MCLNIYLYVLVTLTMTTTAEVLCPNGATCLSLQNCPGLIDRLEDLNQGSSFLNTLLGQLQCGYDDNDISAGMTAKICCPLEFKDINGLNLLPNTSVCGIHMTDRIYGGVQTGLDEHPWTVLIMYKKHFVRPICLPIEPTLKTESFEDYDFETAGWGYKETGLPSGIKLKVNLKVWNTEFCKYIYNFQNVKITDKQLCAGGKVGKDSCNGDSGGALMGSLGVTNNWMAVGITAFGPSPCGATGWPGVYTRVNEYIDWILSTIEP